MQVKNLQHAIDTQGPGSGPGFLPRTLLLLGAGHAHLDLLAQLARAPLVGVQVVLVAPYPRQLYFARMPALVAGRCAVDDCAIALPELVQRAGVRWLQASVSALHADARMVLLDNGTELAFDWLSINTGAVQDREVLEAAMPGARTHALFLRPFEGFAALWPRVAAMGDERALRMAVIGGGAAGVELSLALRQRLPHCAVTLVCGDHAPCPTWAPAAQARLLRALKRRAVTVLQARATGFHDGEVLLDNGARLACDVPVLAVGTQAPRWLQGSGLALNDAGFVAVNGSLQSTSHPSVFACGDVSNCAEHPHARDGVHATAAGATLVRNLTASARGTPLRPQHPPALALRFVALGDGSAMASWGQWSVQGRWVGAWKSLREQRYLRRYALAPR